jgi:hypothetical protein
MQRATLTLDGHSYPLAQGVELDELKSTIENAVHAGGKFVDITVLGNVAVSILVAPGFPILLTTEEVQDDPRDNGEISEPFDYTEWEIAELME